MKHFNFVVMKWKQQNKIFENEEDILAQSLYTHLLTSMKDQINHYLYSVRICVDLPTQISLLTEFVSK